MVAPSISAETPVTDFSTYRPPGVYSEELSSPTVANLGMAPSLIAIVGPSIGHRQHSEAVTLEGTDGVVLAQHGVHLASVVVIFEGAEVAVEDYSLTEDTGDDADASTGFDNRTTISRTGGSTLPDGATVVVNYNYTDSTYFTPLVANSFDMVRRTFGAPFDQDGNITSPLTLAARIAFENGASRIMCLATPGDADAVDPDDLVSAYNKLLAQEAVSMVVPLPVGINGTTASPGDVHRVGTDLKNHLRQAEADGIYQVGIIGCERQVSIDPADVAQAIKSRRIMLAWPNRMEFYNSALGQTIEIAGYYLAAAYAGTLAALPVQFPLTRKRIASMSAIPAVVANEMSMEVRDGWSQRGVAVTERSTNRGLICRHGVTTDTSSVLTREFSLIRARDAKLRLIMSALDSAELIGAPIVAETPSRIRGIVTNALETCLSNEVIVGYDGVSVDQIELDPTVIQVRYTYQPTFPANYILITFGVDITSGIFTVSDEFQGV